MKDKLSFDGNPQALAAIEIATKSPESLLLVGNAGTGKSEIINQIQDILGEWVFAVAPTGVAAKNIGGFTIHSLFGLPIEPTKPKDLLRNPGLIKMSMDDKAYLAYHLRHLIIDEISMVSSLMLDLVSAFLQQFCRNSLPFGGIPVIMVGDPLQLEPIANNETKAMLKECGYKSAFFFDSFDYQRLKPPVINLTHNYRQADEEFITYLNNIRTGTNTFNTIKALNNKCYHE